nr:hypothetical protein PJ912_09075 [Pectobacterium colocasium]
MFGAIGTEKLVTLVKDGKVEAVAPRFKTIRIGGQNMEITYP